MKLTRRGKLVVTLIVLVLLLGVPALGGALYLRSIGVLAASSPGQEVSIEIPEGATVTQIGRILESKGVIESALGLRVAAYLDGGTENIQAGRYDITTGLSARDALDALLEGPRVEFVTATFPEGVWVEDFARILGEETHISAKEFMSAIESGKVRTKLKPELEDSYEGLLFPSTYQISKDDDALRVAQRLVAEMKSQVDGLDRRQVKAMGYTKYDLLIIASMIQAEAKVDSDRAKIARVIYNRLEDGIPLGIDATVIYALGEHRTELTSEDLAVDSPYNTREVAGLPPTPIGAPGRASLEAAARPASGEWRYYVLADCQGHHAFSVEYQDFLEDKAAYQELEC